MLLRDSVALRKESVDRNDTSALMKCQVKKSLSARRAWIEINNQNAGTSYSISRSPQGERG